MSEKNIVYLEVCYGKTNSICIRATKKLKKADKMRDLKMNRTYIRA